MNKPAPAARMDTPAILDHMRTEQPSREATIAVATGLLMARGALKDDPVTFASTLMTAAFAVSDALGFDPGDLFDAVRIHLAQIGARA